MAQIRIYTDEDIVAEVAEQLRHHGYDALSCRDAGNHNQGLSDEQQLAYAASLGRAIVTRNASDFIQLDAEWKSAGRTHAGIVCVSRNPTVAQIFSRLCNHLDLVSAEHQHDTLLWT